MHSRVSSSSDKNQIKKEKKAVVSNVEELSKKLTAFLCCFPSVFCSLSLSVCLSGRWMPCRQHTNSLTWFSEGVFGLAVASQVSQLKWEKQKTIWGKWWSFDKLQIRFFFFLSICWKIKLGRVHFHHFHLALVLVNRNCLINYKTIHSTFHRFGSFRHSNAHAKISVSCSIIRIDEVRSLQPHSTKCVTSTLFYNCWQYGAISNASGP